MLLKSIELNSVSQVLIVFLSSFFFFLLRYLYIGTLYIGLKTNFMHFSFCIYAFKHQMVVKTVKKHKFTQVCPYFSLVVQISKEMFGEMFWEMLGLES